MKNKILLATFVITSAIVFDACLKKGGDDPSISFHSRKARVVGDWKLIQGQGSEISGGISHSNLSWNISGGIQTWTSGLSNGASPYTAEYTFEKDGSFKLYGTEDTDTYTWEGKWNFTDGIGDTKKKTQLMLRVEKITDSGGITTYTGNQYDKTFDITELRNKKMVIKFETGENGTGCLYCPWTFKEEFTLEAK